MLEVVDGESEVGVDGGFVVVFPACRFQAFTGALEAQAEGGLGIGIAEFGEEFLDFIGGFACGADGPECLVCGGPSGADLE
jgi:hypothetical protein